MHQPGRSPLRTSIAPGDPPLICDCRRLRRRPTMLRAITGCIPKFDEAWRSRSSSVLPTAKSSKRARPAGRHSKRLVDLLPGAGQPGALSPGPPGARSLARTRPTRTRSSRFSRVAPAALVRFRPFIGLCAFAGLRLGEAAAVPLDDVHFLRRALAVTRQGAAGEQG